MYELKVNGKKYQIKYANKVTVKSGIISKFVNSEANGAETVEDVISFVAEVLLIGLQKFHADEFGYDLDSDDEKSQRMDDIYDLLDDYLDDEEHDAGQLMRDLEDELMKNGFLASLFRQEKEAQEEKEAEQDQKKSTKKASTKK